MNCEKREIYNDEEILVRIEKLEKEMKEMKEREKELEKELLRRGGKKKRKGMGMGMGMGIKKNKKLEEYGFI